MSEIFTVSFLKIALIGAVVASLSTALLSVFISLKRVAYMSDSFAHISFAGIAIALFVGVNYSLIAAIFVTVIALIIAFISRKYKIDQSNTTTVFLSVSMALGILFIHINNRVNVDITSLLFGNILLVSKFDIMLLAALFVVNCAFVILFYREMLYYSYNAEISGMYKVPINFISSVFIVLIALNVVLAVKISGIVLVTAMMIFPGLISLNIVKNIAGAILLSEVVSVLSAVIGFYFSYIWDIPTGAVIILTMFVFFLLSLIYKTIAGKSR